ncbi:hypothetical protein FRC17_009192 [Serendipita sp. 399]|nr:hypothetical protein FRC17_009192 [Serendipita sp. 399]
MASTSSKPLERGPVQIIKETNDKLKNILNHPLIEESCVKIGEEGNVRWIFTYSFNGKIVGEGDAMTNKADAKASAARRAIPKTERLRKRRYLIAARMKVAKKEQDRAKRLRLPAAG